MSLTKSMLKAMDISDEKIEQILEAHTDSITGLTKKRDEYKELAEKYKADSDKLASVEKELVKANAKIEDADETAQKYKDLQKEFDDYRADVDAQNVKANKSKAYRELLKQTGVSEKRLDSIIKITDIDSMEIDKDGKLKDIDKLVESIKAEWSDFIVTETAKGADVKNPPDNTGGSTFEKMSLAEKMAYANENPDNAEVQAWLK